MHHQSEEVSVSSEENLEKGLEAIQKSVIPVVHLLAGRLGWWLDEREIIRIGLSPFPLSLPEEIIGQLCGEVCRAYSGLSQELSRQNLVCRVLKLIPMKHFLLERELMQCAEYCVPFYGDDMRPGTALKSLENCRNLPCYQEPFLVILSVEVHARLVRRRWKLRDELLPILQAVAKTGKPFLIIAEDIEGEALAALVVNKLRGTLNVCAVKAPGFGDRRKAMLEDIAILTNGKCITEDLGIKLENIELADLGKAKRITVSKENTTIVEGAGKSSDIQGRVKQLRKAIEETTSDYDREKLQERLAKLAGGVAVINIGAATEPEMKEKKARVDDALHATRAAVEEGISAGGSVALLRTAKAIDALQLEGDEAVGAQIVRRAIEAPLRQLCANAGEEGALVVKEVLSFKGNMGYNVATGKFEDLLKAGVVDPTKVTRSALQNAASVAGLLLTTECMITDKPEEKQPAAPAAGMDGMGGMM